MLTGLVALALVAFLSITLPTETVAQGDTATMNFTVINTAPFVGTATCGQGSHTEAAEYRAWCYATVTDNNGYQDVSGCNGTFYRTSVGQAGAPNDNNRYSNGTCQLVGGTANTVNCNCTFFMKYYADGNVEWTGNITAKDPASFFHNWTTLTVASLNALELTTNKVQWGILNVGTATTFDAINRTVSNNTGNVNCSIQVQSAGGVTAMNCIPSPANITVANIKAWIQDTAQTWATGGTPLTVAQAELGEFAWIDNRQHTADGRENRSIYWALNVPSGVNGTCTITVGEFAVMVSSPAQ
jgi:hypothetical protein